MSDAYRTSGLPCPTCSGSSLRAFASRYICDECGGMLIDEADLESSLHDLTFEHPNPRYDYGERSKHACPLCERGFVEVSIVLVIERKQVPLDEAFLRCERHGIWCAGGVLERVFEKASRQAPPRLTLGAAEPALGPDGLPEGRFVAPRAGRDRGAPRPQAVDPFADRTLYCPGCPDQPLVFAADRHACPSCGGSLVGNTALVDLVQNITGRYWELPPIGPAGARPCPVCATPLGTGEIEGVAVDRCPTHGVWFDAGELETALRSTTEDKRGWFARLIKPRR